ncbi:MAG: oligosaccharide flippase family protein [Bacteroidetes bacterium]|nr:oligosaccharide flippase family protein [Bacteroidota bacterium]
MGVIIRQSIATTIIAYAGVLIGYINLMYLYPRFLTPEQVGLMRTLQDAAILMAQFAQFGLAQSIIRFLPKFSEQAGKFINLILLAALAAFALFLALFFLFEQTILGYFQQNAADFVHYAGLVLWMTFITVVSTLLEIYSRSLLQNILPNLLKEIVARLLLGILVLIYFKGWLDFQQVMVFSVLIYAFCLLILIIGLALQGKLVLKIDSGMMSPETRKELITFSALSFAGTAGLIVIGKVDSMMVAGLLGLAPVAIYTTSFYMATVIEIPKRAITQVATPLISRGFEKNDTAEIAKIYHKAALNQFLLGSILFIGVVANLHSIFLLMPKGDYYEAGRWVVIIVGAGKLVDMLFGPNSELIVYSKYYRFNIVLIVFLSVMIVTLNNWLIPIYGIMGAAMGAAITLILFNLVKFIFIWRVTGLQPFSVSFIKVAIIAAGTWGLHLVIPYFSSPMTDMVIRSAALSLLFGIMVLVTGISPEATDILSKTFPFLRRK